MALTDAEIMRMREKVEILAGERGDRAKRALRAGAISGQDVPGPTAAKIAAPPTAADYNKLVDDVAMLRAMIDAIRRG